MAIGCRPSTCYWSATVQETAPLPSTAPGGRLPWVWDYDFDEPTFRSILAGTSRLGRLDRDWAAVRLLEHAPYPEIIRFLGFPALVRGWPAWRDQVRSQSRRRGFDFLVDWLPRTHPELL